MLLEDNPHRITFFQNELKKHKLTVCRHAKAAMKALKDGQFDLIFLDHDLDSEPIAPDDENSGSEVARFIVKEAVTCGLIILHTENRVGREAMIALLDTCQAIPYSKLKHMGLHRILKIASKT